jgi:beta-lactamase class A
MIKQTAVTRRSVMIGTSAFFLSNIALGQTAVVAELAQLERELGGRLGIAALDTGSGRRFDHRGDERFAMCSTFKWMLAAAILSHVDQGILSLDRRLSYKAADLQKYAPFAKEHLREGGATIGDLCGAAVMLSDNTAANLLLDQIGGPRGLTAYLRGLGDKVTRLDRKEPEMNLSSTDPHDPRDTTTPHAMIATMREILTGDVLSAGSRAILIDWLKSCQTGLPRLRAGLPGDWPAGDKTGTGNNGANNDNAIIWPPGRAPILVAAYLSGSKRSDDELDAAHAKLGRLVVATFG